MAQANLHLTLQFLGEVSEQEMGPVVQALQKTAQDHSAFLLALKCVGSFGNKSPFRVIWGGIDGDTLSLTSLQKDLSILLSTLGFPQEKRSYQPHITLGRDVEFLGEVSFEKYSQVWYRYLF
ncbi:RNA 2',3'-cyclic phosphodiesterase [Sporomusa silvacetica DSM 10669]|uniref:RNA 2',3'-cyclic phosphodiesterase n=1 Tax=Sporomusa silvacetica DSM 10669 TaxID=1123289 RepID=A0ABZ3IJ90_9FIRM|nr:2'-5'-RNA ligase [Sporomusa silvacetica DSM 10669]